MSKKNNILPMSVFDFTIFPLPETKNIFKQAIGRNHQKLMVVYATESHPKEDLAFLAKIMSAVKIDLDNDLHLIGLTANQGFSFVEMQTFSHFDKLIVFGISPQKLGIQFSISPYSPLEKDHFTFLFADSLQAISNDKALKGTLWAALKQIFSGK